MILNTIVGEVPVEVSSQAGVKQATIISVEPKFKYPASELLEQVLASLNWQHDELDTSIQPAIAYAGAWHFVIAADSKHRLDELE